MGQGLNLVKGKQLTFSKPCPTERGFLFLFKEVKKGIRDQTPRKVFVIEHKNRRHMKPLFLLLSICCSSYAQQHVPDFKVTLVDDSLTKVLRQYIHNLKSHSLLENEAILLLRASPANGNNPDRSVWLVSALTSIEGIRKSPPVLISELDGYSIVIYFNVNVDYFFRNSDDYSAYLEKTIYSRFKPSSKQTVRREAWQVILAKGQKPDIKVML